MTNTPMIDAFVATWKLHLIENDKEEYLKYMDDVIEDDTEKYDKYSDFAMEFIHQYVMTKLPFDMDNIIKEFGMKKLIIIMYDFNGDEICDDLLEFNLHISHWTETMLGNILKIY